ncbi:flagellar motor switch protein FliG, partial [Escherichia coli]|nr:flagellar motor switch protein FliG [Escherichia coli]
MQWDDPRKLAMLIPEELRQFQVGILALLTTEISGAVFSYHNGTGQNEILCRKSKLNDINRDVVEKRIMRSERGLSVLSE